MQIINPATGEILKELAGDSREDIKRKFKEARQGQGAWAALSLSDRITCLRRFHDALESHKEALARLLSQEVGKPIREARNEIAGAKYRTTFFIEQSQKWLSPEQVHEAAGTREVLAFEPLGVIGNISAWNYPYLVGINVFVPALIAGNAVLYKPSEFATLTGLRIAELLHGAGVPRSVFQTVIGGGEVGKVLLDLPLDGYFFTGSYKTGKAIAEALAGRMVPVALELGGKDPLYVADDVDVEKAAAAAVEGSFYNAGQSCCAVERVYVHEKIYDRFVTAFVAETGKLVVGDPLDDATSVGAITRPVHIEFLESQVKDAIARGAKILTGGKRLQDKGGKGAFFEPTVLINVNHEMSAMKEESFGPVIGLQKVKNDDEAIALMNDTEYGLTAAVYTKDEARAKGLLARLDAGNVYWNCCDRVSPYLPWAGRRHSGLGATLSYLGIVAFAKPKGYHLRG